MFDLEKGWAEIEKQEESINTIIKNTDEFINETMSEIMDRHAKVDTYFKNLLDEHKSSSNISISTTSTSNKETLDKMQQDLKELLK